MNDERIDELLSHSREYRIRLWECESLLEKLGYERDAGNKWRLKAPIEQKAESWAIGEWWT